MKRNHWKNFIYIWVGIVGCTNTVFAQVTKFVVSDTTREVGTNLLTGNPLMGVEYSFEDPIIGFDLDTVGNYVTLQLRGITKNEKYFQNGGHLVRYNSKEKKFIWSKRVLYGGERVELFKGVTIFYRLEKAHILDPLTGLPIADVKNTIADVSPDGKIGFGYKVSSGFVASDKVEGFTLREGEKLWKRDIEGKLGWNNILPLDDSSVIVAAAGLHRINFYTGSGWDYHTATGELDFKGVAVKNGVNIAFALLTGIYVGVADPKLVRDICSNILLDDSLIYFAGKEQIACLDRNGVVMWKQPLPSDKTSKSLLIRQDENLIMINAGNATKAYEPIKYGKPFIASFNIHTGEPLYLDTFKLKPGEFIKARYLQNDSMILVGKSSLMLYDLIHGEMLRTVDMDTTGFGSLIYFIGDKVFVEEDGSFKSLYQKDSTRYYLFTKSLKTLVLNKDLEVEKVIPYDELYLYYESRNDFKFLAKGERTIVINARGQKVAQLEGSTKSGFIGNTFYTPLEKGMLVIDLSEVLE